MLRRSMLLSLLCLLSPVLSQGQFPSHTAYKVRGGNTLPATCSATSPVDVWVDTNAAVDARWFICTSANVWTAQGGAGGGAAWGTIAGTLADQTDLQAALDLKAGLAVVNTFTTGNLITPATDVAGLTLRRADIGHTSISLSIQEEDNDVVASISKAGAILGTRLTSTGNGALSAPAITGTGTWITGGSVTTTKPYALIETAGATSAFWSTSGTGLGVNSASGFNGDLVNFGANGVSQFKINPAAALITVGGLDMTSGGSINLANVGYLGFVGRSKVKSPSDGKINLTDIAGTGFINLQMAAVPIYSFGAPAISGNGTLNTGSKDSAGKVTSTATGAASIVVTFSAAFTRAPACVCTNETTANLSRATSTTTQVTVSGTTVTGDVLSYTCLGY